METYSGDIFLFFLEYDFTWEKAEPDQSEPCPGTEKDAYRLYLGGAGKESQGETFARSRTDFTREKPETDQD